MAKLKVGDKVLIADVDKIVVGRAAWGNGDIVEVLSIDASTARTRVYLEVTKDHHEFFVFDGKPVFHILENELPYVKRLKRVDGDKAKRLKVGDSVVITDLAGIENGELAWDNGEVAKVIEINDDCAALETKKEKGGGEWAQRNGVNTFIITPDEYGCIRKLYDVTGVKEAAL